MTRETQLALTDWLKGNLTDRLRMRNSPLMQTVRARRLLRWQSRKRGRRWADAADVVFTDTGLHIIISHAK